MHATHLHPRATLAAMLALLALAALAALIPAQLAHSELGFGSSGGSAPAARTPAVASAHVSTPTWMRTPLASPLRSLEVAR